MAPTETWQAPRSPGRRLEKGEKLSPNQRALDELKVSRNVGDYRNRMTNVLADSKNDPDAHEQVSHAKSNLDRISKGHDHVKFEGLPAGVMGVNYQVGTHNTASSRQGFSVEELADDPDDVEERLDHEDASIGHAGQIAGLHGLVLSDGDRLQGTEMYEGENEGQEGKDKRGSAEARRENQPEKDYGSGQNKVAKKVGLETMEGYMRKGVSRVETQTKIFKKDPPPREQMVEWLGNAGFSEEETTEVVEKVAA